MKRILLFFTLVVVSFMATSCMKENEPEGSVKSLDKLILNEVAFGSDSKIHLDPATYQRLIYDNGDEIVVNSGVGTDYAATFTLSQGDPWTANANKSITRADTGFFYIHYSDGMNFVNSSNPNYNIGRFSYAGRISNAGSDPLIGGSIGIVLAGKTKSNVVTLTPCCAIIRLDTTGVNSDVDLIQLGFEYNSNDDNNQVIKVGLVDANNGVIVSGTAFTKVGVRPNTTTYQGDFIKMKYYATSNNGGFHYAGVPMLGESISTKIVILGYKDGSKVFEQHTSNNVTLNKGVVYSIHLKPSGGYSRTFDDHGAMYNGVFTVSADNKKVRFSCGNLQNIYGTNVWKFANSQYLAITSGNNNPVNGTTVDLFAKENYSTNSITYSDNTSQHAWSTLSEAEWNYLFNTRSNHADKWALATVADVSGVVILPDQWNLPTGCSFTAGSADGYSTNTYSSSEWAYMERAGAVFLPRTGYKSNGTVSSTTYGYYWSSTAYNANAYYQLTFSTSGIAISPVPKSRELAVRLVTTDNVIVNQ